MVELDIEAREIVDMRPFHPGDQLFLAKLFLSGADHDGGAMRVVGADVDAPLPAEFLEADPDIGLQILDQMSDVYVSVGVWQSAGDEYPPHV